MDINNKGSLINVMHEIIEKEYEIYSNNQVVDQICLSRDRILHIIKGNVENTSPDATLKELIDKGLIIRYRYDNNECYRSIYFDIIHDLIGIRSGKNGKITVLDYTIVKPVKRYLPLYNRFCKELEEMIDELLRKYSKVIDENKYRKLWKLLSIMLCLRNRYSNMQFKAIKNIIRSLVNSDGKVYIIEAPTGWGKTEAFLLPALIYASLMKQLYGGGVKVLLIYPRKALASNQVKRIIEYYIRIYESLKKYYNSDKEIIDLLPLIGIRDKQSILPNDYGHGEKTLFRVHNVKIKFNNNIERCRVYIESLDKVLVECRDQKYVLPITNIRFEKTNGKIIPDILITNIDMLNRFLSTPVFNMVWSRSIPGYIVFDEAHVYTHMYFLHLIGVLSRLRNFIEHVISDSKDYRYMKPVIVFSSATLPKNYINKVSTSLKTTDIETITYKGSEDKRREKIELAVLLAPRPDVAGQWIAQLLAIYNIYLALAYIKRNNLNFNTPIPYKTILFVDSIRYLSDIRSYVDVLLKRLEHIVREHMPVNRSMIDRDEWIFVNNGLIEFIKNNKQLIIDEAVKVHYADLTQKIREEIEEKFQEKSLPAILLSTSTLELGIDIPALWSIIQYRPPMTSDSFIQRIGRAGRDEDTNYIALGTIVLTNQPSDIIYLADENKIRELFEVSELKVPINETVVKQHYFLAILDCLNILTLKGRINRNNTRVLTHIYYMNRNMVNQETISAEISAFKQIIENHYNEIIDYLSKLSISNNINVQDLVKLVLNELNTINNSFLIRISEQVVDTLTRIKKQINEDFNTINEIRYFLNHPNLLNEDIYDELLKLNIGNLEDLFRKIMYNINRLTSRTTDQDIRYVLNELIDKIDELYNYLNKIEDLIDNDSIKRLLSNTNINKLYEALLQLHGDIKHILDEYNRCNPLKNLYKIMGYIDKHLIESNNLLDFMYNITRNGMYTVILGTPIKNVQINYSEGYSRNEGIFQVFNKLANLSVFKPIR